MTNSASTQLDDAPRSELEATQGSEPSKLRPRWSTRQVGRAALTLIALQIMFRWWAVLEGFFFEDDFPLMYRAAHSPLSLDALMRPDSNGHLKPGGYLVVWVLQHVAPMNFLLVAVVMTMLQLAASVMVWLLIRELVGARLGALLPLAVYLFSPLTLSGYLWYATSIETVLLQFVMAASLLFHVRYLRTGRRVDAVISVSMVAVGLANWEKALLVLPVLAMFTLLWSSSGGVFRRVAQAVREHRWLWLTHLVLAGSYIVVYLSTVGLLLGGEGAAMTPRLAWEVVAKGFVPALFGGWWSSLPSGIGLAPPASATTYVIPLLAFAAAVLTTLITRRGAWRAWLFLSAYLMLDVFLLAGSGRGTLFGVEIGRDVRFVADSSVIAAIAIAMAMFPPGALARQRSGRDLGHILERPAVIGLTLLVFLANCGATSLKIVQAWSDTSAELYVRTAQVDIQRLGDIVIFDRPPPNDVLSPWFLEDHLVSRVLAPLPEQPRFDQPSESPYVVADNGHLVLAQFRPATNSPPAPEQKCGWRVEAGTPSMIPLESELFDFRWALRISYFTGTTVQADVVIGGRRTSVTFEAGAHDVYLPYVGAVQSVVIASRQPLATLCITQVSVGQI